MVIFLSCATFQRHVLGRAGVSVVVLTLLTFLASSAQGVNDPPLRFGVFPRSSPQIMVRNYGPLARALGASLGREVIVETDKNFDAFMRRVYAKEFDLVYLNQSQYVKAHRAAGYRAIAKICESPSCTISALIITRDDSGITQISDLRGKTIAFGDPEAIVSHILAKSILQSAGLEPRDYQPIFTKNPPNALLAVYNGTAQAAGIGSSLLQRPEILRNVDVHRLHVLASSRTIPQLPLAVRADLDPRLERRLLAALLEMTDAAGGPAILERIGALRFEVATDAEYAFVMSLLAEHNHVAP